jgi:TolB-like protein
MRTSILIFILLSRLVPSSLGATAPEVKQETVLAMMDIVNNTGEFSSFVEGMPDMLITELMESGEIKLVERTKVQTAMKALKLETSGLTQERNLELGKWLGVDGILFGAFNRVGDQYRLDVRAIDVQTGKINVASSASCTKQSIHDLIPEIGKQLRLKLTASSMGKDGQAIAAIPPSPALVKPAVDSCALEIQFKMIISLLSERAIPHQKVRVYLDNQLLGVSGVVNSLDRYFTLYSGHIACGGHSLNLVHGTVDKKGRWVRELSNQPDTYTFFVRKNDKPIIKYQMHGHDAYFSFKAFSLNYHNHNNGE